jgi:D-alanyl-D-alanine carboxypeptidase
MIGGVACPSNGVVAAMPALGYPDKLLPMTTNTNAATIAGNKTTRSLRTKALALTTTAVLVGSGAMATTAAASTQPKDPMQDVAQQVLAVGAPGYVARIDDGHRVSTTVAGLADTATKRPITGRDQFEIGSNTKTFMATLALQLVDRGKLDLDAPVSKYLPGVVPKGRKITVRMLLNHTSGLFSYTADPDFFAQMSQDPQHVWTEQELLDVAFKHKPNFAPGKGWSYSNTNYTLIGMILQKQTGKSLPDLVQQRIARPLGLKHTYFPAAKATNTGPGYAHGYAVSFAGPSPTYVDTSDFPIGGWGGAAGAIISNSSDLSRFFAAVLGGKLFSQEQLNQMKTTVDLPKDFGIKGGYGLGLMKRKAACGKVWGHGGDTLGHHSTAVASANGRRTAVSDTTAGLGDLEPNDGTDRFIEVSVAAEEVTICEMLNKPVPASVTKALHGTSRTTAAAKANASLSFSR